MATSSADGVSVDAVPIAAVPIDTDAPPAGRPAAGPVHTGKGLRYIHLCPLRWADMDSFGHVNNVVYLRYLEQARVEWMFTTARAAGVKEFSLGTVVAKHEIEYRRPLVYRSDPVRVETWVVHVGRASFTVAYEVRDDDFVYAVAETILVPYDLQASRPRRLTSVESDYLKPYFGEPPVKLHTR